MDGGALNIEEPSQLIAYLRRRGHIGVDERPAISPIAGGVSNRTVLVERESGPAWVLKQALPKLRVAVEWLADPARVEREASGMQWLGELAPPGAVPELIFLDRGIHLLAMTAVPRPHVNFKERLLAGHVEEDHIRQFGRLIGRIHRGGDEQRDTLAEAFADRSFFESLRLEPYYRYTAGRVAEAAAFLDALIDETLERRLTLVHGDYSPKNILIHAGRLILLDHEVIHFGDPAFDLGFALTHLLSKGHHLAKRREVFAQAAVMFWTSYREALGDVSWSSELERRAVRHTLGCLLARVAGRSPLEYLNDDERVRQRTSTTRLMHEPPVTIDALIGGFYEFIGEVDNTEDGQA